MAPSPTEADCRRQPHTTTSVALNRVGDSKHKHSKSRNGCVTCKARRVKCDESKPTCNQCARRKVACGGYKIDIKFRNVNEFTRQAQNQRNKEHSSLERYQSRTIHQGPSNCDQNVPPAIGGSAVRILQPSSADQLHSTMNTRSLVSVLASPTTLPTLQVLDVPNMAPQSTTTPPIELQEGLPHLDFSLSELSELSAQTNSKDNMLDGVHQLWDIDFFLESYAQSLPSTLFDLESSLNDTIGNNAQTFDVSDEEIYWISVLFHRTTCHTLSILEDSDENPWRRLIWPLAHGHPVLYHAIAGLTCLHTSQLQPQLRSEGHRHLRRSSKLLSQSTETTNIPSDVALATNLILAFAHGWTHETPSLEMAHIKNAGVLLEQILSDQAGLQASQEERCRLELLVNTWIYTDVIALFTYSETSSQSLEHMLDISTTRLELQTLKLDSLMGYSTSFFPIMRGVANLIKKVRLKSARRNSPAIISQALDLERKIEDWSVPDDLESTNDHSQLMTDSIQTAEAFRWATLCSLYQTVPELPNQTSYGELAQRILVYLATIPLSSSTLKTHLFPLMVAGADAVEEEDRDFVRERWKAMSKRLAKGNVGRCLDVTEEVWKRRDEYLSARGLSRTENGNGLQESANDLLNHGFNRSKDVGTSPTNMSTPGGQPAQSHLGARHRSNTFPISAAFKKGVDTLTRSGCIDYTVKGRLHWLGVLKDWDLQLWLG